MKKKLITPCAEVWLDHDGILYSDFREMIAELHEVQEHMAMVRNYYREYLPLLQIADARKVKQTKKESRDYLAQDDAAQIIKASAVLVKPLSKIFGNLFIKFSKPPFPTKLFSDEKQAREWLLDLNLD
ncbi:MAG: hypothetical protein MK212_15770 [Saprospiraceae bacterium]|nr:hypothetical protein [Saprospiraceae bacterium]